MVMIMKKNCYHRSCDHSTPGGRLPISGP